VKVGLSGTDSPTPRPNVFPYTSAAAFRPALRDRFAAIAKTETRYSLDERQRLCDTGRESGMPDVPREGQTRYHERLAKKERDASDS
jgi:hypothetical protein